MFVISMVIIVFYYLESIYSTIDKHHIKLLISYGAKYSLPKLSMWTKLTPALHHDTNPHIATSNATHSTLLVDLTIYTTRHYSIIAILIPTQPRIPSHTTDTRRLYTSQYYTHILQLIVILHHFQSIILQRHYELYTTPFITYVFYYVILNYLHSSLPRN